jgi:hypothetical protein
MLPILHRLERSGAIVRVPVLLGARDLPSRDLWWTKGLIAWWQNNQNKSSRALVGLPDQLNQAFADFISGRPLTGITKIDPPKASGGWRLKTPDLRIYGWSPEPQKLILAAAEFKQILAAPGPPKDKDLGKFVVAERKRLGFQRWEGGEQFRVFPRTTG